MTRRSTTAPEQFALDPAGTGAGRLRPVVRTVAVDRPWTWLEAGWRDFVRAPGISIAYGGAFAVVGYLLTFGLYAADMLPLVLPLAAGFTLVGPLAALGLYDVSRRIEAGSPVSPRLIVRDIRSRIGSVAAMGLVLMLFMLAWICLLYTSDAADE